MASRTEILLVCDLCGKDAKQTDVETHLLTVDEQTFEAEACSDCWWKAVGLLIPLAKAGRKPEKKSKKRTVNRKVVDWPGSNWQFTSHSLIRLGERHITPLDALQAAENPETVWPGLDDDSEVRIANGVKAVVDPLKKIIIIASYWTNEEQRKAS